MWFDVPVPHGDEPGDVQRPATENAESIWSTDAIPVRDEPLDIVWAKRPAEIDEPISLTQPRTAFDEPIPSLSEGPRPEHSVRSKFLIGAGVLLAVAVVVGVMVRSGDDETAAPNTTADGSTPSTTSEAPTTTDDPSDGRTAAETATGVASTTPIEIELPPAVAAIQAPTEVVMLTDDGLVHTLSLPSGRVRSVALTDSSSFGGGGPLVVAPEGSVIAQPDGTGLLIVPRTGPPVSVAADELGAGIGGFQPFSWWRAGDGTERFVVSIYPPDGGNATFATVGLDGDVVPLLAPQAVASGFGLTTPDGTWIVNDAGGAYEVDATGTSRRIDSGVVQAAARDHRLVRECDESLQCSTVLVRSSDGERRVIDPALLPEEFNLRVYGMTMAPDGSAVSVVRSGANQEERVIIDLGVGEVATAPTGFWQQGSTWAADSSGIFDARIDGPGLQFVARTGEIVTFGEDLGQVVSVGVRWPDAELDPTVTVVSETVSPARPLPPTGITLVGALTSSGVTYIDIDAGVAQSWGTTQRLPSSPTLIKSGDAVLALGASEDQAFAFRQGVQEPLDAVFAVDGKKLAGPVDGTIWVPASGGDGVAYRLVTTDGLPVESVGATIDLPDAELLGGDGRGGLVVRRAGDVFAVGVDGADRLTTGDLVAIGADVAYVRKCVDIDTCDVTRVDRRSGARSTLDVGFGADIHSTNPGPPGAWLGSSVSPDGNVMLVKLPVAATDSPSDAGTVEAWAFADTANGRLTVIDGFDAGQPVVWSADSNFAAVLADSNLFVFDRAAGELVPLSTPRLRAIGSAASSSPAAPAD
jgi:hypothetical protein